MPYKYREIIKIIEADGWYFYKQKGSHKQYHHPTKAGTVTIAGHKKGDDVAPWIADSIFKQAQIKK